MLFLQVVELGLENANVAHVVRVVIFGSLKLCFKLLLRGLSILREVHQLLRLRRQFFSGVLHVLHALVAMRLSLRFGRLCAVLQRFRFGAILVSDLLRSSRFCKGFLCVRQLSGERFHAGLQRGNPFSALLRRLL